VKQNFAEKMFTEQLDGEYVQGWSDRGGVGMAEMIYSQLKERFGTQQMFALPPSGPIPLQQKKEALDIPEKSGFKILNSPQLPESSQFIFQGPKESFDVSAPWDGVIEQNFSLNRDDSVESFGMNQQALSLKHSNGLSSKIVFEGKSLDLNPGDVVRSGDKIGRAEEGSGLISWKVTKKV
jgi:hypothetical protein